MKRLAHLVTVLVLLLTSVCAQQRAATVRLADGRTLSGRVVAMSLEALELEVDGATVRVPSVDIRSCQFQEIDEPEAGEAGGTTPPPAAADGAPGSDAGSDQLPGGEGVPAASVPLEQGLASGAGDAAAPVPGAPRAQSPTERKVTRRGPIPDVVVPGSPEALPADLRHVSLWRSRLQSLDEAYPWLAPAAPTQWASLGLLLLIGLGLAVHLSVQVVGAEAAQLSRSVGVGAWYLFTGVLQVAMVPVNDFSVALMLLGNSSIALFALSKLFGLTRWWAVVALIVQLGCAVIAFGVLELVGAVLGSVGVAS